MEAGEQELVRRARQGDPGAFEALVLAHQRFVYNLALRAVSSPPEAEDLAQEAFLRAWTALPTFRGEAKFRTWLYRIVINLCYNRLPRLRQELSAVPVEDTDEDTPGEYLPGNPGDDPAARLENLEQRRFLQEQVKKLPEGYRVMVLLRFGQEMPYEEIADVMGLPLGTVKTGLFRARRLLREALREYEESQRPPDELNGFASGVYSRQECVR